MKLKRFVAALVTASMLLTCAACGGSDSSKSEGSGTQSISVDKNLTNVEFTIPADYIESVEDTLAAAEEKGYKVTQNDDGSLTYKISKAEHEKLMTEMKQSVQEMVDEILADKENFSAIKNIEFNDDCTKATVTVDYDTFSNSFQIFGLYGIAIVGPLYQLYDGVTEDKINTEVQLKDETTGEIMDTMNYPADLTDTENDSAE